ncbi:hypothetical protein ACHAXA_009187, partial [Cyclostephanos tholiformis]
RVTPLSRIQHRGGAGGTYLAQQRQLNYPHFFFSTVSHLPQKTPGSTRLELQLVVTPRQFSLAVKMTVHAIHIFDRKGKTLFTKRYTTTKQQLMQDAEQVSEQRKLIFGMLFSLRELVGSLTPEGESPALHSVKTGAGTLHCYETISGLRIALYTNNNPVMNTLPGGARAAGGEINSKTSFQTALKHIYSEIWVECVVRSPLYRPEDIQVDPPEGRVKFPGRFDIKCTNFELKLDEYLKSMPWFL